MSHHLTQALAALGATTGTLALTAIIVIVAVLGRRTGP